MSGPFLQEVIAMPSQPRLPSSAETIEKVLNASPLERMRMIQAGSLAAGLGDPDSRKRAEAREQMLALGRAAVPALLKAIQDRNANTRWQAAKALSLFHDPETAPDLMDAMEDDDFGVRWLAAEGLIAMGPSSLDAVLQGLTSCFDSIRMREGARHVLHALVDGGFHDEAIDKLLHSLQGLAPAAEAAWSAEQAWEKLIVGKDPRTIPGRRPAEKKGL
jgi:HEAT repeat protein